MPDYLIIGHIARDHRPRGSILGGTCSYAGLTAHRLGLETAAVTSYGNDIPSLKPLSGIEIKRVPARSSTSFENNYTAEGRFQKWFDTAALLAYEDVPAGWRNASILHLAPIAQEISPTICRQFKNSLRCATVQGWLRGRDADANVICQPHPQLIAALTDIDVLIFGQSDLLDCQSDLIPLLTLVRLAVETLGPLGCNVFAQGRKHHVPVKPEIEKDPTGAGDIFAAAFFTAYYQNRDPIAAARFANACASLSVRKTGLSSVPGRSAALAHMAELYGI